MTEWWAFKPITTAFEKTRNLLLEPFNAWTWIKLIIIVFFVGSSGNRFGNNFSNLFNYRAGPSDSYAIQQGIDSILSNAMLIWIILGLVVLLIAIGLLFAYLRNVFSFVLIQAVTSGDVHIIKPFMDNLGRGFRLFIFTLLAGLLTVAVIVACILIMLLCIFLAIKVGVSGAVGLLVLMMAILVILLLIAVMVAFSIAMSIFIGFTYDFVAPMVFFKGMGIVESWKWLWASIKKDWQQYGVYVITRWVLELGIGVVMFIIIFLAIVVLVLLIVAGAVLAAMAAKASLILAAIVVLALLVVAAIFIIAILVISMPVAVYFRYYSLDVLKQIDPSAVAYSARFTPPPPPPPSMLPA